jgi:ABC-type phosphate transport system permease subunit
VAMVRMRFFIHRKRQKAGQRQQKKKKVGHLTPIFFAALNVNTHNLFIYFVLEKAIHFFTLFHMLYQ